MKQHFFQPCEKGDLMYFQMQPFDLLGITIKSLAEIEKEVSKLPRMGQVGPRSSLAGPASPSTRGVCSRDRRDLRVEAAL